MTGHGAVRQAIVPLPLTIASFNPASFDRQAQAGNRVDDPFTYACRGLLKCWKEMKWGELPACRDYVVGFRVELTSTTCWRRSVAQTKSSRGIRPSDAPTGVCASTTGSLSASRTTKFRGDARRIDGQVRTCGTHTRELRLFSRVAGFDKAVFGLDDVKTSRKSRNGILLILRNDEYLLADASGRLRVDWGVARKTRPPTARCTTFRRNLRGHALSRPIFPEAIPRVTPVHRQVVAPKPGKPEVPRENAAEPHRASSERYSPSTWQLRTTGPGP